MNCEKKIYKEFDTIRLIACFSVLLYHLNILKGGYLAVCTFFVLSGYLSCISAFKKEKFSIIKYYYNRIKKLYIPLIIVVFTTISIVTLLNINWINLKPETTSVILGYNNFWQINANMDYFARHISSPFIHLWYIAILLQYDLIFPIIFKILQKIGNKIKKKIPCIITIIYSIIMTIFFYKANLNNEMVSVYYNTLTRIFSLLYGLSLGFIHSYYKPLIPKKIQKKGNNIIFYMYLLILIIMLIFIDAKSIYYATSMILTTLITCRLIDYATINISKTSIINKIIKSLSDISYEIYLLQYPVIYLFQYININNSLSLLLIIIIIIVLSYILHFTLNIKKKNIMRYIIIIILICLTINGIYKYSQAEDYTQEMNELKNQLEENEKLMLQNKEKYEEQLKKENEEWQKIIESLDSNENNLKEIVSNLPITAIGDSVMLGAIKNLNEQFPNGYFDAKISRTAWKAGAILNELIAKNMLGNPIVFGLGTNGDCSTSCKDEIMKICAERKIYWLNTTNDKDINEKLKKYSESHPNLNIIDWYTVSLGHTEYFYADGIHLTEIGRKIYTETIFNAIYQNYLKEFEEAKQAIINKHEEEEKNKITFYGNNLLLNAFEEFQNEFKNSKFVVNKEFNYTSIKEAIEKSIKEKSNTNKIVFIFDKSSNLTIKEYQNLTNLLKNNQIYIVTTTNFENKIESKNIKIINLYEEIQKNNNYVMKDGIHLTKKGNEQLILMIKNILNQ